MRTTGRFMRASLRAVMAALIVTALASSSADAKKLFKKQWVVTVMVPDSPMGNHFGVRTFTIKARKFNEPPSPLPLNKLTASSVDGPDLQGVWRQEGKAFSLTFELPCEEGAPCGTVVLRGRFTSKKAMSGQAYVMWDTRDSENIAAFETVNGTFDGFRQ